MKKLKEAIANLIKAIKAEVNLTQHEGLIFRYYDWRR